MRPALYYSAQFSSSNKEPWLCLIWQNSIVTLSSARYTAQRIKFPFKHFKCHVQTYLDACLNFLLFTRRRMLSSISLQWQRGKGTVPKCIKSDHHHELCYLGREKKKLILPAGGQNSMLPRKMQAKLLLPLRKVAPAAALWYQTSSTCQARNAVWCCKKEMAGTICILINSAVAQRVAAIERTKITSLLLIRKLDKTEEGLKELSLEKFTFHSISQQSECSTETWRYSPSSGYLQKSPVNKTQLWKKKGLGQ